MTTHWACNQSDCHNFSLEFGASLKDPLKNGDHCLMRYTHERCDGTLRLVEPEAVALAVASLERHFGPPRSFWQPRGDLEVEAEPLKSEPYAIPIPRDRLHPLNQPPEPTTGKETTR